VVYFLQCKHTMRIKIGFSSDVEKRLDHVRSTSPTNIVLLGVIDGDRLLESRIHRRCEEARICGEGGREWFCYHPVVLDVLREYGVSTDTRPPKKQSVVELRKLGAYRVEPKVSDGFGPGFSAERIVQKIMGRRNDVGNTLARWR